MNRRHFLAEICVGVFAASASFATSFEDAVVAQLRAQGYTSISVERTLLGRVKISALSTAGRREIIFNPRTGELLRDLWIADDGSSTVPQISSGGNTGGSGGDVGEDEDEGEEGDVETEQENSGSGGSRGEGGGGEEEDD